MASTTWRISGVDTEGHDLYLSALHLYNATVAVDSGAVITCSHTPIEGVIANLIDGDPLTTCKWAARDVSSPGFYIEWTLPTAKDVWCARIAAPTAQGFIWNYDLRYASGISRQGRVVYQGAGVLSLARPTKPFFNWEGGWIAVTGLTDPGYSIGGYAESSEPILLFAAQGGVTNAGIFVSADQGETWVRKLGAEPGTNGFLAMGVTPNGQTIVVGGYGSAASRVNVSRDGGETWSQYRPGAAGAVGYAACALSADGTTMLAVGLGSGGRAAISKDGGLTWAIATSATASDSGFGGCAVSPDGQILLTASFGVAPHYLSISRDGGTTWAYLSGATGGVNGFGACAISDLGDRFLVSATGLSGGGLNVGVAQNGTLTWSRASVTAGSDGFWGCGMSGDGLTMAAGGFGTGGVVSTSQDGGASWSSSSIAGAGSYRGAYVSPDGYLLSAYSADTGGNVYRTPMGDPTYAKNPRRTLTPVVEVTVKGGSTFPQELGPDASVGASLIRDTEFGGNGRIYGTVERKNTPTNVPMRRRVRLHRSRDGLLVRETWSNTDGTYEFKGINMQYEYDTIAWDNEMSYRSVVANNLKPEAM